VQWVEARLAGPAAEAECGLVVELPGGARLEVQDARQAVLAAQLLRALQAGGTPC
jgi:hypothetical protein